MNWLKKQLLSMILQFLFWLRRNHMLILLLAIGFFLSFRSIIPSSVFHAFSGGQVSGSSKESSWVEVKQMELVDVSRIAFDSEGQNGIAVSLNGSMIRT